MKRSTKTAKTPPPDISKELTEIRDAIRSFPSLLPTPPKAAPPAFPLSAACEHCLYMRYEIRGQDGTLTREGHYQILNQLDRTGSVYQPDVQLSCRRRAPGTNGFPKVERFDSCGEFIDYRRTTS